MLSPRGGTSTGQLKLVPSPAFQQAAERRNRPGQGRGALLGHDTPMCL
jgi:hypothetical protein